METYQLIQPENPMQALTLFDADKKGLEYFIEYVCNTIESGMDDPLKVLAISKKMEYITKRINERIKEQQKVAADKYGDRPFEFMGTEMHYCAVYTRYDFAGCNDPKWKEAKDILEEREAMLKGLTKPIDLVIDDEVVTVQPPKKVQVFGLKTTVK